MGQHNNRRLLWVPARRATAISIPLGCVTTQLCGCQVSQTTCCRWALCHTTCDVCQSAPCSSLEASWRVTRRASQDEHQAQPPTRGVTTASTTRYLNNLVNTRWGWRFTVCRLRCTRQLGLRVRHMCPSMWVGSVAFPMRIDKRLTCDCPNIADPTGKIESW